MSARNRRSSPKTGRASRYRSTRLEPERHRPVVGECHLHVGAKYACGNMGIGAARAAEQVLEQRPGIPGLGSGAEARARALVGVRGQGELWHEEQSAVDLAQRAVHAAFGVREHPVAEQALAEALGGGAAVALRDADERQKSRTDLRDALRADAYLGAADTLDERDHAAIVAFDPASPLRFGAVFCGS